MPESQAANAADIDAKVAGFSYEEARSRLVDIVSTLERGSLPLEDAIAPWELGEALVRRCQALLDGARARLNDVAEATGTAEGGDSA